MALAALPGVEIRATQTDAHLDGKRYDLVLVAEVRGQPIRVVVEAKANAYPRDIRAAAHNLESLPQRQGSVPIASMVVAPAVPPASRELLRQRGLGYWDTGGSLYLDVPGALFWIDRPVPGSGPRRLRRIFRGRSAQVLHALLLEPERPWHIQNLAARAEVAPSTVHQVFTFLEEQLWVEMRGKGPQAVRILQEPGALLDAWAEQHTLADYSAHRLHRWARDPTEVLRSVSAALEAHDVEHALTLTSGASLVAPFATSTDRLTLLVPVSPLLHEAARAADLNSVDEGETVTLLATRERSPLLFRRRIDEVWVASDVQLYLDLSAWPQRGKEQARHLRAERLGF